MAKNLKLTIKNTQIAQAINLGGVKSKLAKKKEQAEPSENQPKEKIEKEAVETGKTTEAPRRARSKSVFAEATPSQTSRDEQESASAPAPEEEPPAVGEIISKEHLGRKKSSEELRREIFGDEAVVNTSENLLEKPTSSEKEKSELRMEEVAKKPPELTQVSTKPAAPIREETPPPPVSKAPTPNKMEFKREDTARAEEIRREAARAPERVKLGPTGRHIKDLLPPKKPPAPVVKPQQQPKQEVKATPAVEAQSTVAKGKPKEREAGHVPAVEEESSARKGVKGAPFKEFRDVKPPRRQDGQRFDARDRQGLRDTEEDQRWRKRKLAKRQAEEIPVIRPTTLVIRTPISLKDLAAEMKLKASQLVSKLFLQGAVVTLNDILDDETTIQLIGQEFGCDITIDTSEERRIRVTDKNVKEEIQTTDSGQLITRAPVVAFMGHVDHGKTSLIDAIRKSNRVAGEAGAITQHIGAFRCHTPVGDIAILDTPGHEAFSAMRARGTDVTDIVVLVVAGDEGIRQQTIEAIEHAKTAKVTIVVAINKSDKPGFNPENVYRQLADQELLPEVWGGQTLTVNCSAVTGAGLQELLETLALQAEILELRANLSARARGTVLESEMHKGLGAVATVLVQNGTLHIGDALVFDQYWGRVKTMRDEFGRDLAEAYPSTPVAITGLSGLPDAGQEFIVVKNEREAREIAEARHQGMRQSLVQQKKPLTVESLLQQAQPTMKKMLNIVLRADVQGSLEALKVALQKIESTKAELNIIFAGVGEISESDIQLASTSKAVVIGFHTQIESHAESLIKQLHVQVKQHDVIYHAIDDVKALMTGLLDKIALETNRGKAEVRAVFKSSHTGVIAGCMVIEGTIQRNYHVRVMRQGKEVGRAPIASLRRVKEDVREVHKGIECGIALSKFSDIEQGDILESFEISYISQEL